MKKRCDELMSNNKIIYPRKINSYTIMMIIGSIFWSMATISFVITLREKNYDFEECFILVILITLTLLAFVYCIRAIYMIFSNNIFIEYNSEEVKISKVFRRKIIKISDIKEIKDKSMYKNPFTYIQIVLKDKKDRKRKNVVFLPRIWFLEEDLRKIITFIVKNNKEIDHYTDLCQLIRRV
ncbi:putative membrane protein [Clostridium bornimense]|uniref:Putative membrane protein n=1 Tax=Clostridium bornimense TaxID=1216932 RepID=W6S7B9_9CLOT|nr:hypothetical protein [Clostridium bornimense]CDM70307.1 putative membrane protein [Clostridium bornimense]